MKFPGTFLACLTAFTLSGSAWAQIYESRDAEGNPVYTDTPAAAEKEIYLPKSNIADAVKESPDETPAPAASPSATGGVEGRSTTTITHDDPEAQRERGNEGRHEVLDAEPRHEVGDDE
jgi:hypothetical protein